MLERVSPSYFYSLLANAIHNWKCAEIIILFFYKFSEIEVMILKYCSGSTCHIYTDRDITIGLLFYYWPIVFDAGPTLKQYRFNVFCLLGMVVLYAPQSFYVPVIYPQQSYIVEIIHCTLWCIHVYLH